MNSQNPVLPNFVKILSLVIAFAVSGASLAGHHSKAEDEIKDLKDMSNSTQVSSDAKPQEMRMLKEKSADDEASDEAKHLKKSMKKKQQNKPD